MDRPKIVEEFNQPSTDKQIAITVGMLLHRAVELIDINTAVQPADTHDVAQAHHHNLVKYSARMAPTDKKHAVRQALAILDNSSSPTLIYTLPGKYFFRLIKQSASEITEIVINEAKRKFTVYG